MKLVYLLPLLVLFIPASAFAEYSEIIITPAAGSGVPGCEDTVDGCFIPNDVTINVGDKVIFKNTDSAAHTFTSGTPTDADSVGAVFDSSLVMAGNSFEWTPIEAGEVPYFDMVHPWMTGNISVEGNSSTPTPDGTTTPTELTATAIAPNQIKLSWLPPSETFGQSITGYNILREVNEGIYDDTIGSTNAGTTTFTVSNLQPNKTYTYVVSANIGFGTTGESESASATTLVVSTPNYETPQIPCDESYPDFCIPENSSDWDCDEVSYDNFTVYQPDPHRFDGDRDGIGCETSNTSKIDSLQKEIEELREELDLLYLKLDNLEQIMGEYQDNLLS